MDVIIRMSTTAEGIYAYARSIINRCEGKILGTFNDPETGQAVIIGYVSDLNEVDIGYSLVMKSLEE